MAEHRNLITIGTEAIEQLFYKDIPVVTFEQIAAVHGVSLKTVQSSFQKHRTRFTEGKHFYLLDPIESKTYLLREGTNPNGVTVFTKTGYLLLVKPMRDDRAWQVQEMMIEAYFQAQQVLHEQEAGAPKGGMLVQMAVAIEAIEARQRQDQLALIQAQNDVITLQRDMLEAKENALLAIQAMQWVTIRQYVEIAKLHRQMPPPVQRQYALWLTTYCMEHGFAMYQAATADTSWPKERTYCIAVIQETLPGWLSRRQNASQETLHDPAP